MVLRRPDAEDAGNVAAIAGARFIYLRAASPLHLRSVLKDSTAVGRPCSTAWHAGAVIAGSSAGAMVLGDPMVDPRGGAFTLGLGLLEQLAIVPHHNTWPEEQAQRTMQLAPKGLAIAAIDEQTAIIRDPDGAWRKVGDGAVPCSSTASRPTSAPSRAIDADWAVTALCADVATFGCRLGDGTDSMTDPLGRGAGRGCRRPRWPRPTSRPFTTLPNSEYCGGRRTPSWPLMMKNWLPLVLGPALAMASEPIS